MVRQPGGAGGVDLLGLLEVGDGLVDAAGLQAECAEPFVHVRRLGLNLFTGEGAVVEQGVRVIEDGRRVTEGRLRAFQVAGRLAQGAEVETDLQTEVRPLLEGGPRGRLAEQFRRLFRLVHRPELTGVEGGGVEVVGVQFQHFLTGGQGVVGAVEGEVERRQRPQRGGGVGVEAGGFLVGTNGLDEVVILLRDGADAERLEGFDVVQFASVGRPNGDVDGRQLLGLLGAERALRGPRAPANGSQVRAYWSIVLVASRRTGRGRRRRPVLRWRVGIIRRPAGFFQRGWRKRRRGKRGRGDGRAGVKRWAASLLLRRADPATACLGCPDGLLVGLVGGLGCELVLPPDGDLDQCQMKTRSGQLPPQPVQNHRLNGNVHEGQVLHVGNAGKQIRLGNRQPCLRQSLLDQRAVRQASLLEKSFKAAPGSARMNTAATSAACPVEAWAIKRASRNASRKPMSCQSDSLSGSLLRLRSGSERNARVRPP